MPFETIVPAGSAKPIAPYSPGTKAGNTIYVAGTLALTPDGQAAHPGDAAAQTRQILETIKSVVEAGGGAMGDIAFNHIFLKSWDDYGEMNKIYAEYFPGDKPARYCIQCGLVREACLVEIASVAHLA